MRLSSGYLLCVKCRKKIRNEGTLELLRDHNNLSAVSELKYNANVLLVLKMHVKNHIHWLSEIDFSTETCSSGHS